MALAAGDLNGCAQICAAAAARNPADHAAHFLLGIAFAEGGRLSAGLQSLERALALAPAVAEYQAQHARLLTMDRREAEARAAADRAIALTADADALTLDTIGCVLARLGDHAAALPLFERAVALQPDNAEFRFNLATSQGFFGNAAAAEAQYEALLTLSPTDGRAYLGLASLRRQTTESAHVARMEAALTRATDPIDQLRIHYAAAKAYQDLGRPDDAFRHLSTGNRAHKARLGYSIDSDSRNAFALRSIFSRAEAFNGESHWPDAPIFVTGLPRTGTTLVDRILSSHPAVTSAGELQSMPLAIKRLSRTRSRLVLDPETVIASAQLSPQDVGRAYLARARQHAGAQSPVFVDKLPLNFLYIGYIARALPHARIICLRRNPMDSIWSNYKNLFATTSSYYAYSYDLLDTARFYLLFDEMMAFWETIFPGRVLPFSYEALIDDQQGQTRRLLDHCGLQWDAACLDFQSNAAPVATPSAAQVRRPLYRDAVEQWRAYAAHLEPARQLLERAGIAV